MKKFFKILTCFVLMIAVSVALVACGRKENKDPESSKQPQIVITEVSTKESLKTALSSTCDEIKLTSDITIDDTLVVTRKVTFDLNGKTLTGNGCDGVIYARENADITIKGNGKIVANEVDSYAMVFYIRDNAKVTVENGTFEQSITGTDEQYDMIYVRENAQIIIKGGKFESVTPKWTLNVRDADNETAKIIVKGGEFKAYNPAAVETEPAGVNNNFVAEGFKSQLKEGTTDVYEVVAE